MAATCDLRKPCSVCKKMYGRQLRPVRRGNCKPQLEARSTWKQSQCCCAGCRVILRAWGDYMQRADSHPDPTEAVNNFLYGSNRGTIGR